MSSKLENNFNSHLKDQTNNENIFLNSSMNKTVTNFNKNKNDNSINNESTKNIITVNINNKMKALLTEEETENNRSKIKITRNSKPKESIIVPSNKN